MLTQNASKVERKIKKTHNNQQWITFLKEKDEKGSVNVFVEYSYDGDNIANIPIFIG